MGSNNWDADPEKYARLAEPFESMELAEVATRAFIGELATLREKYRMPELIVQFQCYITIDDEVRAMNGGAGWGDQLYQTQLAKRALDQEFDHLARVTRFIADSMPRARRELITDPQAKDTIKVEE